MKYKCEILYTTVTEIEIEADSQKQAFESLKVYAEENEPLNCVDYDYGVLENNQ